MPWMPCAETIGGMYGNYYWECIGRLFIYIIIAILIGLVLRKPFGTAQSLYGTE